MLVPIPETPTGKVIKEPEKPVCNKPYFEFRKNDCCLDKNNNSICDIDEKTETAKDEATVEKKTLEKVGTFNEIKQYDVSVHDKEGFDPKELTISSGDQVSWKNEGHRDMILLMFKDGEQYLQQNAINSGDTFVHQFNETGSYDIYWNIIKGPVTSKLIVQERSSEIIDVSTEELSKKGNTKKFKGKNN